ncbi:cytochrome oxidase assembly [Verticillium alfalfae VaMs.102]|uniref:Cytochrome oxidase assembly n=1 Tax=Verticillium alfalfae (strain VaMs.102 / ATCC MYA-4576 / FGSC 10136) TaxID=526221 RepID=C9SGR4_VERA1|nr:cytochrome oxidase assembly [Verticillium alfalfae VaMs.102]EEY17559.1 cytochrome oxidase assembly [Verticillium alfalfae VaMs.102]
MISRLASRRALQPLRVLPTTTANVAKCTRTPLQQRWMTAAPKPGQGPLMERRADHLASTTFRWSRSFPIFVVIVAVSSLAIFNYQKSSSPVVSSTLYALRVSPKARELLGDEVYFKHQIPWISGEMNQLHGRIDIAFSVKGSRSEAVMRFASYRLSHKGMFETTEWSLEMPDGRKIDLLDGTDPFKGIVGGNDLDDYDEEAASAATRGFRQQPKLK